MQQLLRLRILTVSKLQTLCVLSSICSSAVICVSFSRSKYLAKEVDGVMTIIVEASGFSFRPYFIIIEPVEHLPVGDPGIQCSQIVNCNFITVEYQLILLF